eukprot:TRINITY_DN6635_c0_g1_i3.p1 TRINITY_DN6635_c0_g1~~TRINITY_DN6635_c0_g1_i3.p1  ORF type:complete len:417 (+),score=82.46 TRINITY_DN6635_c0_g1_i3:141-1253(+)
MATRRSSRISKRPSSVIVNESTELQTETIIEESVTRKKTKRQTKTTKKASKTLKNKAAKLAEPLLPIEVAPLKPVPRAAHAEIQDFYTIAGQLEWGTLVKRPSKHIRSPYVGDATLNADDSEVLVHVPGLEMGGLVVPGSRLRLLKKDGNTKTDYSTELVYVDEIESATSQPVLVAHNPLLANRIIKKAITSHTIEELHHLKHYEVKAEAKITDSFRVDFAYRDAETQELKALVEVKSVCLADYHPETKPARKEAVFINNEQPYKRHALFPYGKTGQKFGDEKVVSARAIKHVQHLIEHKGDAEAYLVFLVTRGDCKAMRACQESCPVFARELRKSIDAGLKVLAYSVSFNEDGTVDWCGRLPFVPPAPN